MVVFITVKVSFFISSTAICTQVMWAILLRTHATYICDFNDTKNYNNWLTLAIVTVEYRLTYFHGPQFTHYTHSYWSVDMY